MADTGSALIGINVSGEGQEPVAVEAAMVSWPAGRDWINIRRIQRNLVIPTVIIVEEQSMGGRLTSGAGPRIDRTTALWALLAGAATTATLSGVLRSLLPASRAAGGPAGVCTDDGVWLRTEILGRRARVVVFDQRGHGRSGWGTYRSAIMDWLGRDLGEVIDEQAGEGPVVFVGHSMGGMAVISLAGQRPELFGHRITGVALLSTAAGHLPKTAMPDRVAPLAVRASLAQAAAWSLWFLAPVIDRGAPFRRPWGRRWLAQKLFGGESSIPEAATTALDTWVRTRQSVVSAFYPAMVAFNRIDFLHVFRSLPTLVLTGDDDRTIPWQRSKHLAHLTRDNARFLAIPGAGHMVNLTHPQAVNTALLELLDRVPARTRPDEPG